MWVWLAMFTPPPLTVAFLKRAQIFAAVVWQRFGGEGLGDFADIDELTMFADYRYWVWGCVVTAKWVWPWTLLLYGRGYPACRFVSIFSYWGRGCQFFGHCLVVLPLLSLLA